MPALAHHQVHLVTVKQRVNYCSSHMQFGNSRVNPTFHTTDIGCNLGSTLKFPNAAYGRPHVSLCILYQAEMQTCEESAQTADHRNTTLARNNSRMTWLAQLSLTLDQS